MSYALIKVQLPAVKNLIIYRVYASSLDHKHDMVLHDLQIEDIKYVRNKQRATGKAKAVTGARVSKRKAIA